MGRKIERTSKENAKLKGEGSSRVTLKLAEDCLLFPERRPGFIFYEFHPTSSQASGVKRVKKLRGKQLHSQFRIAPEGKLIFCPFSSFSSGGKLGGNRREAILDCFVLLLHFCSGVCCQFAADPDFPLYLFRVSLQNSNSNSNFFARYFIALFRAGKTSSATARKKNPMDAVPLRISIPIKSPRFPLYFMWWRRRGKSRFLCSLPLVSNSRGEGRDNFVVV